MKSQFDGQPPTPPASPSVATTFDSTGLRGRITGVTRIGAKAGFFAMACIAALVLAIVYAVSTSGTHRTEAAVMPTPQVLPTSDDTFSNIPGANPKAAATTAPQRSGWRSGAPMHTAPRRAQEPPQLPQSVATNALQTGPAVPDIRSLPRVDDTRLAVAPPTPDPAIALREAKRRQAEALAQSARQSAILVNVTNATPATASVAASPAVNVAVEPAPVASPAAVADQSYDPNVYAQKAKTEFLKDQKSSTGNDYLAAPRQAAISPYEVQAGSIIPATLITGINSDLPGTMIAQVSQNVYDSKTGAYVLIPAGSKIVGKYDSQVTNGQSRVLVAWQRIIFPDSSFITIGAMSGADTAGYSGLTGKVDDHSGKLFRNAILFSLIGAGATLLQPRTIATIGTGGVAGTVAAPSVGSQVAGQVGTQVSQLASQSTHQGLQQQPTIEVRPGYLFNVMVDRDLVLPGPYAR